MTSHCISLFFTNIFLGRVPSVSLGTSLDMSLLNIVMCNFFAEAFLTLLFYMLFIYSIKNQILFPYISNKIKSLQEYAIKYKSKIDKYGIWGLLFFVFMPFWMTGPVVGIIIGHFMNFSLLKNLSTVLLGTLLAIFCWAVMIEYFIDYVQVFIL